MATTVRVLNDRGEIVDLYVVDHRLSDSSNNLSVWRLKADPLHPSISTTNEMARRYERYAYLQEQLALNAVRTGLNLVDEERTRHILEGAPILRATNTKLGETAGKTTTVRGWSGGHANPLAAQFGKTQIPDFWTEDRFMFEVSDVMKDGAAKWYLQEGDDFGQKNNGSDSVAPRFVCVEERYGVPIRVVAERVDDSFKCVTAFPDYSELKFDETLRVDPPNF